MKTKNSLFYVLVVAVLIFFPPSGHAQSETLSPKGTDPVSLKLMQGFPVAPSG